MEKYKKWLSNAPMKRKFLPVQLMMISVIIIMSIISVVSLSLVNTLSKGVFDENVENTELLNEIIETMYLCRVLGRDILLQDDEPLRQELYTRYIDSFDQLDTKMDSFAQKISGEKLDVFISIIENKELYKDSMIVSADLKNEGGKDAEALEALRSVTPIANEFFESVKHFLGDEKPHMDLILEQNNETVADIVVAGIVLNVVLAFVLLVLLKSLEKTISVSLVSIEEVVSKITNTGDMDIDIPTHLFTKDELGFIAIAMNKLKNMLLEYSMVANTIANGDYTISVAKKSDKDMLSNSLQTMIDSGNNVLSKIKEVASYVSTESEKVFINSQSVDNGVLQQADSVKQLSTSLRYISDEVKKNSQTSTEATAISITISADMNQIDERIKEMIIAMGEITSSSQEIKRIIKTIEDISFQTNILALNAAVEAARAGEAGKGFSVVADEVRNLANKSSIAASQTAQLIENSVASISNGEKIANKMTEALNAVVHSTKDILKSIVFIDASSNIQSIAIEDVQSEVNQISSVVQENKLNSEESTNASRKLTSYATQMSKFVSEFKLR